MTEEAWREIEATGRSDLEVVALAAWLNVKPDQIPECNRAHLNPATMQAWRRVAEAIREHCRDEAAQAGEKAEAHSDASHLE